MDTASEASAIEGFPHVINRICGLWGTHELDGYISHLMTDTRDGQRKGFPAEVTAELLFLAETNKLIRAIDLARNLRIPLSDAYQRIDKQDRGFEVGDPIEMLVSRDVSGRSARELGFTPPPSPPPSPVAASTPTGAGGSSFFAQLGKLALVVLVLYLAWRFIFIPLVLG